MINSPINASLLQQDTSEENVRKNQGVINWDGIHDHLQLFLVALLIIASMTVVFTTNGEIHQHDRYLRTYFNLNLLEKNYLGIYEDGLNIDQSRVEFTTIKQIKDHLTKIINISTIIQQDAIILFVPNQQQFIQFEIQYRQNAFNNTRFSSVKQALEYFHDFQISALRKWLLLSNKFKVTINLGQNEYVKNYSLTAEYRLHSLMMVQVKLDCQFDLTMQKKTKLNGVRIVQQLLASILFAKYLYQVVLLNRKSKKHRLFRDGIDYGPEVSKQYFKWYFFLEGMCIITLISQRYSPICSFLQIIPIFQFHQRQKKQQNEIYSFNNNLRHSFLLVIAIFFQLFIVLNGFIFYSMLMYPGDYFDDYVKGFFSYFYQMFQVGTYEIFTQLQAYGNFAYILYAILYFYVFQVGNSLIPALFVVLIEMKMTERFLKEHVSDLAHQSACPKCLAKNSHLINPNSMQIVINSSKLSPIIPRKMLEQQKIQPDQSEALMLYIEQDSQYQIQQNITFHKNMNFSNYSRKILSTTRKLQTYIFNKHKNNQSLQACLRKIEMFLQVKS